MSTVLRTLGLAPGGVHFADRAIALASGETSPFLAVTSAWYSAILAVTAAQTRDQLIEDRARSFAEDAIAMSDAASAPCKEKL